MRLTTALAFALTLVLGCATTLAFAVGGGAPTTWGPELVEQRWPSIYALMAAFAAGVGFVVARKFGVRLGPVRLAVAVLGAWFGQYLVLASGLVADELNPRFSVYIWLLATGGPLQPLAALIGGWLGLRLGRGSSRAAGPARAAAAPAAAPAASPADADRRPER